MTAIGFCRFGPVSQNVVAIHGFVATIVAMVVVVAGMLAFFRYKRWL